MHYEYRIIEAADADNLEREINEAAEKRWEPVNAYVLDHAVGYRHYALLRRTTPA